MKRKKDQKENPEAIKNDVVEQNNDSNDQLEDVIEDLDLEDELDLDEESEVETEQDKLNQELQEMTSKAEEYLDGWQRARAEFANYKKRIARENSDIHQYARGEVIKLYLDIVDDLERALQEKPNSEEGLTWAGGIEIIYHKLIKRLESEGVIPMNALGEEFDPNVHEALMKEESEEYKSGQIIEVIQEGYWIGEKVLRPALVRVAA
jgi:molecular chaperone GrpE